MENYELGIRKFVKGGNVKFWQSITAKVSKTKGFGKATFEEGEAPEKKLVPSQTPQYFIYSTSWRIFINLTILLNFFITLVAIAHDIKAFMTLAVFVSITSIPFAIDFIVTLVIKFNNNTDLNIKTKRTRLLILEGLTLAPISEIYLFYKNKPNQQVFWLLRILTLIRCYRIPYNFSKIAIPGRYFWKVFLTSTILYLSALIFIFSSVFIIWNTYNDRKQESNEGADNFEHYILGIHFTLDTILNIGYGDITFHDNGRLWMCTIGMVVGFAIVRGILTGVLATQFANMDKNRAIYKKKYQKTINSLKGNKADKKIIKQVAENMKLLWQYRQGQKTFGYPVQILPISMQKEIFFDINFGILNRSIVFSMQPKSYLRCISLLMRNTTYLPGDTISDPTGCTDAMICISSGVIEIVLGEAENAVISLAAGSVIGESSLFLAIPKSSWVKACTYVEMQVLMKKDFSRLSLIFPNISKSIREDILFRLTLPVKDTDKEMDRFKEIYEKQMNTQGFVDHVREYKRLQGTGFEKLHKVALLSLYVLSEGIPKVKTLPLNLVRKNPLILRPYTHLTEAWDLINIAVILVVVFMYPYLAGFVREVSDGMYLLMLLIEIVYVVDIYMQCTTAILRRDNFTYHIQLKTIIAKKLRSPGFYIDVLATFDFTVYSEIMIPNNKNYAFLLLSLNRIMKIWRLQVFFNQLENNLSLNLLFVRFLKYLVYFSVAIVWGAVSLYLEACPEEVCIRERWFSNTEANAIKNEVPRPLTQHPSILSLYWSCISIAGVGYGDIVGNTEEDFAIMTVWVLFGVLLTTCIIAQASATMKNLTRDRAQYQEEVFSVDKFMIEHQIPKTLRMRVRNFFQVQWNYDEGETFKDLKTQRSYALLQKQVTVTDLMKDLLTVPIFRGTNVEFLRLLTEMCKVRILPPNEIVVETGTITREIYILTQGYCLISEDNDLPTETSKIICAVNAFGFLEMLLGTPIKLNVRCLTHCKVTTLSYSSYLRAITIFPTTKIRIEEKISKDYTDKDLSGFQLLGLPPISNSEEEQEKKWQKQQIFSDAFINVYSYHKSIALNYWQPFKPWGKFQIFSYILVPYAITPHSYLMKIWMILRVIRVLVMGLFGPIVLSLPHQLRGFYNFILTFQVLGWIDMYLMFHVAYYNKDGLLMFHPSKTAVNYLSGNFIIDIVTEFPVYTAYHLLFENRPDGDISHVIGLLAVLQFYKFFQVCVHLESDILRRSEVTKTLKFVPLAILVTNIVTGLHIILECYSSTPADLVTTSGSMLSIEFQQSLSEYCFKSSDANATMSVVRMYVTAFYWVTSTMTTCGFGDLTAHSRMTMITVIATVFLGVFLYGYMFASLTSNMISAYTSVTKYRRKIIELSKFVENVNWELLNRLKLHYEYNWRRTEGSKPQKMLTHLHTTLRDSLMGSMYEETVKLIAPFEGESKSILRIIGKYLDDMYFLRGEPIVRNKDILEYIYIVHRGVVEVVDEFGTIVTVMGKGGMFGNLSNKTNALSSVTIIARNNLELLKLECNKFFRALEFVANSEKMTGYLTSLKTNYLKPLNLTGEEASDIVSHSNTSLTGTVLHRTVEPAKDKYTNNRSFLLTGMTKFMVNLKNSCYKPKGESFVKAVILPDTVIAQIISMMEFTLAFVSGNLAVYMFFFQDFTFSVILSTYFLDFLFYFKIPITFSVSFYDKFGDYVVSREKIKLRYTRKKLFIYDIISVLPLEIFALTVPKAYGLQMFSVLHLNRALRFYHVSQFFTSKSNVLMANKVYLQLGWVMVCISIMLHVTAGIWYFQACPFDQCQKICWVKSRKLDVTDKFQIYTHSLYFTVGLFTATAFGDISAYTTSGMVTAIVFMIFSQFCIVLLAGSMATVVFDQILTIVWYEGIVIDLKSNFTRLTVSKFQMHKMWNYVSSLWQYKNRHIPKFIRIAPYAMKCEVMYALFGQHLSQSYVFSTLEDAFLRQLANYLELVIFFAGNYIVQQGDIDNSMYFISKGRVSVLTIHSNLMETIHFVLEDSDQFGISQGLVSQKPHDFSYRAESTVEVLLLTYANWKHLLKYFPRSEAEIYEKLRNLPHLLDMDKQDELFTHF